MIAAAIGKAMATALTLVMKLVKSTVSPNKPATASVLLSGRLIFSRKKLACPPSTTADPKATERTRSA